MTMPSAQTDHLLRRIAEALGQDAVPPVIGVAVSGGGDSMALLDLLRLAGAEYGFDLRAATVDHGLRPGSAREAADVAAFCAARGIPHATLRWQGWDGRGNLQAAARSARYRLLADWAAGAGVGVLALGHTLDDQAETVLMRLARASGPDGLAAMPARFVRHGMRWTRPLLGIGRDELRAHLSARGIGWAEDPSNEDLRFDRVRARRALAVIAPLGVTPAALAHVARTMAEARAALDHLADAEWARRVTGDRGDILIRDDLPGTGWPGWDQQGSGQPGSGQPGLPAETARRLLLRALRRVSGGAWPPRHAALDDLAARLAGAGRHTLAGCLVTRRGCVTRITREWNAVRGLRAAPDALWDGRWRMEGPAAPGLWIAALGPAGLALCPGWRASGMPRDSLLSSPAVWAQDRLIAAPLAGKPAGWRAICDD